MGKLEDEAALRFAETMLYWRGHLKAKEVQDFLGVSERTARSLISKWRRFDAILPPYRPGAERCLVPTEEFDPGPAVTDPNVALSLLLVADHVSWKSVFSGRPSRRWTRSGTLGSGSVQTLPRSNRRMSGPPPGPVVLRCQAGDPRVCLPSIRPHSLSRALSPARLPI